MKTLLEWIERHKDRVQQWTLLLIIMAALLACMARDASSLWAFLKFLTSN